MNRKKELKENAIILGIGNLLPKFISFLVLPLITGKLSKMEYGTYDFILTLVAFLLPIATLQVQSSAFRFLIDCRTNKQKQQEIISNIIIITFPISLLVSFLLVFYWSNLNIITKVLISLYFLADITFITFSQITRGLSYNKDYSISSIILSVINAIGIVTTLNTTNYGISGIILSLTVSNLIAVMYLILKNNLLSFFKLKVLSWKTIKKLVSYSWPMIPNNLSAWVLSLSDRIVITKALGLEANAIYAVANKIPNLLSMAQSIFVMAWQENASVSVNDKNVDSYYSEMLNYIFKTMIGFTALIIGFTPIIFKLIIQGDYGQAYLEMPILILAIFFSCLSSFIGGIYIAHKKTVSLGITTFLAAFLNLIIDLLLINIIGITAGSVSTLVSYSILYLYRLIDVRKFQKISYNLKSQIYYIFIIIIMLVFNHMHALITDSFNFILGICLFILLNKEIMKTSLDKLKKIMRLKTIK